MSVSFLDENGTLIQPRSNSYNRDKDIEELKIIIAENLKLQRRLSAPPSPSRSPSSCTCGGCSCGRRNNESIHPAMMIALILACILMLKRILDK